ncbi:MAG: radical SAM family heme chaperone HemW [Planctomycetes bacterium]|nr:radical SAM family heme chaperone HemW [Planctomycetota bacterium]
MNAAMLGLYVHIPFCQSKCRYCAFYSEVVCERDTVEVVSAILRDMERYDVGDVETVYIGGGSPSCLPREELYSIVDFVSVNCGKVTEFSVEVNPGQVDEEFLKGLFDRGVNRLSIGAQSFDNSELEFIGRRHDSAAIEKAFDLARAAGFGNISIDLIFAIPGSTIEMFGRSLDRAISLGSEHVSAYSLSIEPSTPFGRAQVEGEIVKVDETADRAMYEMAIDRLGEAGIVQYEISNFARCGFECRHNLGCWANDPYIGVGPAASSYYNGVRFSNVADVAAYVDGIGGGESVIAESHRPDTKEVACETAVVNLRRRKGIVLDEFKSRTGFDLLDIFGDIVERFVRNGMIVHDDAAGRVYLSKIALPIADTVICEFANF